MYLVREKVVPAMRNTTRWFAQLLNRRGAREGEHQEEHLGADRNLHDGSVCNPLVPVQETHDAAPRTASTSFP